MSKSTSRHNKPEPSPVMDDKCQHHYLKKRGAPILFLNLGFYFEKTIWVYLNCIYVIPNIIKKEGNSITKQNGDANLQEHLFLNQCSQPLVQHPRYYYHISTKSTSLKNISCFHASTNC